MRKLIYFILAIVLFVGQACVKSPKCCVLPQRPAELKAQKNGSLWYPSYASGKLSEADSLTINATSISPTGYDTKLDSINIKLLYSVVQSYKLVDNQATYVTWNTDGTLNTYKLDPAFDNELNVTAYKTLDNPYTTNPNQIEISGTFSFKFIDPNNPAGITFSNGTFYTIMNQ